MSGFRRGSAGVRSVAGAIMRARRDAGKEWLRRRELHPRPPGYEPDALLLCHGARVVCAEGGRRGKCGCALVATLLRC